MGIALMMVGIDPKGVPKPSGKATGVNGGGLDSVISSMGGALFGAFSISQQ